MPLRVRAIFRERWRRRRRRVFDDRPLRRRRPREEDKRARARSGTFTIAFKTPEIFSQNVYSPRTRMHSEFYPVFLLRESREEYPSVVWPRACYLANERIVLWSRRKSEENDRRIFGEQKKKINKNYIYISETTDSSSSSGNCCCWWWWSEI